MTTDSCTLHVEFRGDARSARLLPGDRPAFHTPPAFRCIPQHSRVVSASESGVLACGNGVTGEITVTTTPGSLGDLPYIDASDSRDGFYFQPTVSRGISLDSETGELSAELVFGVRKKHAANWAIRCSVGAPANQPHHLDPSGGALLFYSVGSYDMNEDASETVGDITLHVTVHLSATHTPGDDDPR